MAEQTSRKKGPRISCAGDGKRGRHSAMCSPTSGLCHRRHVEFPVPGETLARALPSITSEGRSPSGPAEKAGRLPLCVAYVGRSINPAVYS